MKNNNIKLPFIALLAFTNLSFADNAVNLKIQQLEMDLENLQNQISQLKSEMTATSPNIYDGRISNLESYAVQLHDVITQIQQDIALSQEDVNHMLEVQERQPHLGVYGTITAGKSKDANSVIDGESFEIVLSGKPHKKISYFTEIEFERAASVAGSRGGQILIEQAYTDIEIKPWLNFRSGILLMPFGNIETDHYAPLRPVISKPLTTQALAPSDWTDNGFGAVGGFNISENWIADYQAYIVAGLDGSFSTTGLRGNRQGFGVDNNNNKAFAAKINLHNTSGLSVGFSLYDGKWDDDGKKSITGYNVDFNYKWKWLEIMGEYTDMDIERFDAKSATMDGYYVRSVFSLENILGKNWLSKDFEFAKLGFVFQYDQVNVENFFDFNLPDNWEKRYTYGLQLKPIDSWIFKLNYENADSPGFQPILRGDSNMWIISMGYVF